MNIGKKWLIILSHKINIILNALKDIKNYKILKIFIFLYLKLIKWKILDGLISNVFFNVFSFIFVKENEFSNKRMKIIFVPLNKIIFFFIDLKMNFNYQLKDLRKMK